MATTTYQVEEWFNAAELYSNGEIYASILKFQSLQQSARVVFNIACCYHRLDDLEQAEQKFCEAIALDEYFALPYFVLAELYCKNKRDALNCYEITYKKLRGNIFVDYRPLGLNYLLYACEVLANQGWLLSLLNQLEESKICLIDAEKFMRDKRHLHIKEWFRSIQANQNCELFRLPSNCIFGPSQSFVTNLKKKNYLGKAMVISEMTSNTEQNISVNVYTSPPKPIHCDQGSEPINTSLRSRNQLPYGSSLPDKKVPLIPPSPKLNWKTKNSRSGLVPHTSAQPESKNCISSSSPKPNSSPKLALKTKITDSITTHKTYLKPTDDRKTYLKPTDERKSQPNLTVKPIVASSPKLKPRSNNSALNIPHAANSVSTNQCDYLKSTHPIPSPRSNRYVIEIQRENTVAKSSPPNFSKSPIPKPRILKTACLETDKSSASSSSSKQPRSPKATRPLVSNLQKPTLPLSPNNMVEHETHSHEDVVLCPTPREYLCNGHLNNQMRCQKQSQTVLHQPPTKELPVFIRPEYTDKSDTYPRPPKPRKPLPDFP